MVSAATASTTGLPEEGARSGRVGYPVPPGPSILETMWGRLVTETDALMDLSSQGWAEGDVVRNRLIGKCLGMAEMIAILLNPYNPNVDEVRTEVMRRIQSEEQS